MPGLTFEYNKQSINSVMNVIPILQTHPPGALYEMCLKVPWFTEKPCPEYTAP